MKRYWQFLIVGVICLLAALLWAQPAQKPAQMAAAVAAQSPQPAVQRHPVSRRVAAADPGGKNKKAVNLDGDDPLPGSSSSLPLLAVIGFGVLAGGITSAMRTRE